LGETPPPGKHDFVCQTSHNTTKVYEAYQGPIWGSGGSPPRKAEITIYSLREFHSCAFIVHSKAKETRAKRAKGSGRMTPRNERSYERSPPNHANDVHTLRRVILLPRQCQTQPSILDYSVIVSHLLPLIYAHLIMPSQR
jgi:hypothetical protein